MSLLFISSILFSWFLFFLVRVSYFVGSSRISVIKSFLIIGIKSSFPAVFRVLVFVVLTRYLLMMSTANVPLFTVPIIFYSYVLFNAVLFWVSIAFYGFFRNPYHTTIHMLPYGAPSALMFFLPLVEIFSQVIRPLTLTIRFATNISAGHIIMFIFSYFSLLSSALAPVLYLVLIVLLVIEVFIAFLQSYIFVTLLSLYFTETLEL